VPSNISEDSLSSLYGLIRTFQLQLMQQLISQKQEQLAKELQEILSEFSVTSNTKSSSINTPLLEDKE